MAPAVFHFCGDSGEIDRDMADIDGVVELDGRCVFHYMMDVCRAAVLSDPNQPFVFHVPGGGPVEVCIRLCRLNVWSLTLVTTIHFDLPAQFLCTCVGERCKY